MSSDITATDCNTVIDIAVIIVSRGRHDVMSCVLSELC